MSRLFNGTTSKLVSNRSLTGVNMTLMAWIKPYSTGEGGNGNILRSDRSGSANSEWYLRLTGTNRVEWWCNTTHATIKSQAITNDNAIELNKWHHVCAVQRQVNFSNTNRLVIDGYEPVSYATKVTGQNALTGDALEIIHVGSRGDGSETFDGLIAFVQIFNTNLLTDAEIRQAMYYPGSVTRNLLDFWPLVGANPEPNYGSVGNYISSITNVDPYPDMPPVIWHPYSIAMPRTKYPNTNNYYAEDHFILGKAPVGGGTPVTCTPTVISMTASLPDPVVKGKALVSHSVISNTFSLPAPVVTGKSLVSPSVISSTLSVNSVTVTGAGKVTPSAIAGVFSLPTPTIIADPEIGGSGRLALLGVG